MERIAIIAITKNGIKMAKGLKEKFSAWEIFAPEKFSDDDKRINWYNNSTTIKIKEFGTITKSFDDLNNYVIIKFVQAFHCQQIVSLR